MSTPRIRLPDSAAPGAEIEVRTLIDHPMVTALSSPGPRDMLARFEATLNGTPVFTAEIGNGTSANPTFTFHVRAPDTPGPAAFEFTWTHEDGQTFSAQQTVTVG
ncbi:MAG: thiosulfate oxidation carrier complex protein SoxZ [Rhodobacteraceae bacterium]|jgi:sulfur-oxidizing protein SoxZ|nr:thiosulfate oxidation carrier complex protein SoxZ [Paracoccaceae bacterium]